MRAWPRVRGDDHLFEGTIRNFERFEKTDIDQDRTPSGHYALMVGLKAWSDLSARARELCEAGLKHATARHVVHSLGIGGPYQMVFPLQGVVDFGTSADLVGTFLWALSFDVRSVRNARGPRCVGRATQPVGGGAKDR